MLTGVSIALLNVCRAAAGLAKLGSVWRGLFSFFGIGMRSFSETKRRTCENRARILNHYKCMLWVLKARYFMHTGMYVHIYTCKSLNTCR